MTLNNNTGADSKVGLLLSLLAEMYPGPTCTLEYDSPIQLLVSTILSAQCTDKRVNMITPALFAAYPDCYTLAEASDEDIAEYIRSAGLYKTKSKNIKDCAVRIRDLFEGIVPDNMEDLLSLPGVGRKTANLILGEVYSKPSYVVDTHCKRICKRLGLTKSNDAYTIEMDLMRIIPPEGSGDFCHRLVDHGRSVCRAVNPLCDRCGIRSCCDSFVLFKPKDETK